MPADLRRAFFDMLLDSQWWSAEALRDYQRSQLSQFLRHAADTVPYYHDRLAAVLLSNGDVAWDKWHDLPLVPRADVAAKREQMQSRALPMGHGPLSKIETSGSSGVAITITTNGLSALSNNCLRWRSNLWSGLDWRKRLLVRDGSDPERGKPPDGELLGPWGPPWLEETKTGAAFVFNKYVGSEATLEFFRRKECSYINTGPKTAHAYALEARRLGIEMSIEAFACQGAAVDPEDRKICEEVFGARLIEIYSSKEGGQMAHPCEYGRLHVNSEAVYVEIVDEQGRPCSEGEIGRVVITPFFSTGQPLIRYEQGDLARVGGKCACGRAHPVIDAVIGRQVAMFTHPDGRATAQILPFSARQAIDCEYLQIAQVGPVDFEVRYVPKNWDVIPDEEEFARHFRMAFFSDARIIFRRMAEIPLTPAGKFLEYLNEYRTTYSSSSNTGA